MNQGCIKDFAAFETGSVSEQFERNGYVIIPVENRDGLNAIRQLIAQTAAQYLKSPLPADSGEFLDKVHLNPALRTNDGAVSAPALNGLRLAVIGALRSSGWFRPTYYSLARQAIDELVGNELAMQRGIGLSVQLPEDDSSLLPIHADVWDGDSPFEIVAWLPLVDCFRTKSMYIVPLEHDRRIQAGMNTAGYASSEALFEAVSKEAEFLTLPYGSILLFSQTVMHGNRINAESTTRWSLNCRFKSILSPYADKKLGEFFEPISMRAATRIGIAYTPPGAFK